MEFQKAFEKKYAKHFSEGMNSTLDTNSLDQI